MEADFGGYATKAGLLCTDGRTITAGAFKHNDQKKVPLVWAHQSGDPLSVLGHGILEHREDGMYVYGFFNDTESGQHAKGMVLHKDIERLSIHANRLTERSKNVMHGEIIEVSLVLAGANPGALIDNLYIRHSDGEVEELDGEALIFTDETFDMVHADTEDEVAEDDKSEKTVKQIWDSMTDEQREVAAGMVAQALKVEEDEKKDDDADKEDDSEDDKDDSASHSDTEDENEDLKHNQEDDMTGRNVFDQNEDKKSKGTLTHAQLTEIVADAKSTGSFKEALNNHQLKHSIDDIEILFPDHKTVGNTPELLARQADWVPKVLNAIKHSPFSKLKSIVADLTAAEARAKGYVKGNEKAEEVVQLLKRTTSPTTVYKKQALDRDDLIDITELDVVEWLWWEIRFMLNEEIARAVLIGDGRSVGSPDKIKDPAGALDGSGIRSISNDNVLYAHPVDLPANISASDQIDEITRARTFYRGSGSPTMFTTDKNLIDLLLLKDKMGRRLYGTTEELASALRVKEIVPVEVMEETPQILAIIVNLTDYSIGTNKGGELTRFDDFDIDFNKYKYLMETRLAGALTKPKSALVIKRALGTSATPVAPSFDGPTNTITIPTTTGIDYLILDVVVTGTVVIEEDTTVTAEAKAGYYIPAGTNLDWTYNYTAG